MLPAPSETARTAAGSSRPTLHLRRYPRFGAGIVGWLIVVISSSTPIRFGEGPYTCFAPLIAEPHHLPGLQAKQEVIEVIGVSARQCARQDHQPVGSKRREFPVHCPERCPPR